MARRGQKKRLRKPRKKSATIVRLAPEDRLKRKLQEHLSALGFVEDESGAVRLPGESKEVVRSLHRKQRYDRLKESCAFLERAWPALSDKFAEGAQVDPRHVRLRLQRIEAATWESDLFRLACMSWSVPVSQGFGRRLRYLVWDEANGKLAGVIALGDPVFNLSVRDNLIGWTTKDRSQRLVNLLDAYVLGAVPPYSQLLGGKAVACLVRSREIYRDFTRAYGGLEGVISGENKKARLLAVTTSSSMGRSSVYNRLKLAGQTYFRSIGFTQGWGHFHIPDDLFLDMRRYLRTINHRYADQNRFGQGPNWRLRSIRAALDALGYNDAVLKHGIRREVFISELADNGLRMLKTGKGRPVLKSLAMVDDISRAAVERWIVPRAARQDDYVRWTLEDMRARILNGRDLPGAALVATQSRRR